MTEQVCWIYTTLPSLEIAKTIAHTCVREKYAACVNLIPQITSVYVWDGKLEEASEVVALFKTRQSCAAELKARLAQLHPYEVPCILELKVVDVNQSYAKWVIDQTK